MTYNVFEIFSLSQFASRIISPVDIPKICVWTAPDTPVVHRSDDEEPTEGEIAEAGGDITIVLPSVFTSDLLSVVVFTVVWA